MRINYYILIIAISSGHFCFGQEKGFADFSFVDKYGSTISVKLMADIPKPIDSAFISTNINGKLILPSLDTTKFEYLFLIYKIAQAENNSFELEIYFREISKRKPRDTTSIYLSPYKKRSVSSSHDVYLMTIEKINARFIIKDFKYIESRI